MFDFFDKPRKKKRKAKKKGSVEASRRHLKCPEECSPISENIVKASNYGKNKDKKRWKCTECGKTFKDPKIDYLRKLIIYKKVLKYWQRHKKKPTIRFLAKKFNINRNTVQNWLVIFRTTKVFNKDIEPLSIEDFYG